MTLELDSSNIKSELEKHSRKENMMNPQALEKYRNKKGLSITELSMKMDKTAGWYSRIKDGKIVLPSKYIVPLAELFGVKPERLAKEYFSGD